MKMVTETSQPNGNALEMGHVNQVSALISNFMI